MTLPRRIDVDARAILARLDPRLADASLTEVGEGWDNIAYAVDGHLLLRVGKHTDVAERRRVTAKDVAVLAFAGRNSSLPTNKVLAADPDEGAILMTLVPGEPAEVRAPRDRAAFAATLATFLTRLHMVPVSELGEVVEPDRSQAEWLRETSEAWSAARHLFDPRDQRQIEDFLAQPVPDPPRRMVFCHNDLGEEHILLTNGGAAVSGVIDWSDAVLGDPARDLALLWLDFGVEVFEPVLAGYEGLHDDDLRGRTRWFAARAGVEGVTYRAVHARRSLGRTMTSLRAILLEQPS
ncbi:MAG TPA: aminoglycoside phosphotransferase family protein [Phycicoccus sp.]|jgi:aminoglycoside phosphotransferase (APT) family kinase protein|nr:aminoglycoside phosphotransferase family protein [Phycicoccus sp.]HQV91980.1 aminoglycoside phosphotransferase family protein [Phycicoccus sp.]